MALALVVGLPVWVGIALLLGESLASAIVGWCITMVIGVAVLGAVTMYERRRS